MFRVNDDVESGFGWYPFSREGGEWKPGDVVKWPYDGKTADGVVVRQYREHLGGDRVLDWCEVLLVNHPRERGVRTVCSSLLSLQGSP